MSPRPSAGAWSPSSARGNRRADPAWVARVAAAERRLRDPRRARAALAGAALGSVLARGEPRRAGQLRRLVEAAWWLDRMRAAVAFDAAASAGFGFVSSWSWSHTSTGADRALWIILQQVTDRTVSSISYGAQTPTEILTTLNSTHRFRLFRLVAPATGANTISITFAASTRGVGGSLSCTGVDQSTPNDAIVEELTGDASIAVASATNDLVLDYYGCDSEVTDITPGAGQTESFDQIAGGGFARGFSSREAGAASVTMSWSAAPGAIRLHWGINVNQVPPKAGLLFLLALSHPFYVFGQGRQ